jgi:signal peptidase I
VIGGKKRARLSNHPARWRDKSCTEESNRMTISAPTIEQAQPRRSRIVAALLSLIAPGSGHVYAGRPLRGLVLLIALFGPHSLQIAGSAFIPPLFEPLVIYAVALALLFIAIYLFGIVDAVRMARRPGAVRARWYAVVGAVFAVWLAGFAVSQAIIWAKPLMSWRTFSVPSTSMEPTLRLGEWFIGDMTHFRNHEPMRGDVVVYRLPSDPSTVYVKRIVGIAGDRVQFREGRAFVNGTAVNEPYIRAGDPKMMFNNTAEFVVPAGHFFAAGDNRANSMDSRVTTHGFVPLGNLLGRATEIFWSNKGTDREGLWIGAPAR